MDVLHRMAQALLELETLDGFEVDRIIKGGSVEDIKLDRDSRGKGLKAELDLAAKETKEKEDREAAELEGMTPNPFSKPAPA